MSEVAKSLDSLRAKVEKLVSSRQILLQQVDRLEQSNSDLRVELDSLKGEINSLKEANQVLRMAKAVSGEDQNTRDLKLRINEYIREIDRCIALINR
ncbi:MAG: hypothetical protein ACK5C5_09540 [Bacteroidota bacterium]|jgi:FtsZ-binding cell division protein ZapB